MKKLTRFISAALLVTPWALGCAVAQAPVQKPASPTQQRVLFVAIDGFRSDGLIKYAPNLRKYGETYQHTWHSRVAIPISASSWCSIFTGLGHERTGVTNNAFTGNTLSPSDNQLASGSVKTVFNYLRDNKRTYAVVSTGMWDGIQKIANYNNPANDKDNWIKPANNQLQNEYAAQLEGVEVVLNYINNTKIDMLTYYTHHVDNAGHKYGHDPDVPEYATAIKQTDGSVARLLEAVDSREKHHHENWLVLISTDHGGSARSKLEQSEKGQKVLAQMDGDEQINAGIPQVHLKGVHGLRNDAVINHEQTTTFIIMKSGNMSGDLGKQRTNKDITPTVLNYLLPTKKSILSDLDGTSLLQ